jgi:DnaJ-class molecular chaperone
MSRNDLAERTCFAVCPKCGGEGVVFGGTYFADYPCDECSGTGAVEEEVQSVTDADLDEMDAEESLAEAIKSAAATD